MSAIVEQAARRPRRRADGAPRRRNRGPREPKTENAAPKEDAAPREKRERPESIPVPAEWAGQTKTGVVSTVIRKGRVKFGFIHICPGPEIDEKTPRIYFSFGNLPTDTQMRRGYVVTFKVSKDEQDRLFAENVALTAEGSAIAAKREEEIAAKRAERAANPPAAVEKKERAPREKKERAPRPPREPREPREEKPVSLVVSCEGHSDTKTITFDQNASIGKMKRTAVDEFGCEISFQIYAGSEFLTKAILNGLNNGDKIRLAAPTEPKA